MIYYGYYSHIDGMFLFGITRFLYQRRVVMILETGIMIENAITYVKQIFAADSSGTNLVVVDQFSSRRSFGLDFLYSFYTSLRDDDDPHHVCQ